MKCSLNTLPEKQTTETLGRVLVLGLGKSGKAAVEYCTKLLGTRVSSLVVYGGSSSEDSLAFAMRFQNQEITFVFDCEDVEGNYDLCIVSPGIPQISTFYQNALACSQELVSELEFAWRESAAESVWVAITGTNGKTTTTSLIAHILVSSGYDAQAVGNIGMVALDAVSKHPTQMYVAEVSSYQLASTRRFAPRVVVELNITPDHLTWHGNMEAYIQAKFKALENLSTCKDAVAILDATNDIVRGKVRELKALEPNGLGFSYIPVGTSSGLCESMITRCGSRNAAYVCGDLFHVEINDERHAVAGASSLQIPGEHNVSNALMAVAACVVLGVPDDDIQHALATFAPLEHRIELCGIYNGVRFYNDSKGTNVDSTLIAIQAFEPGRTIVLLGGRDKMTDLAPLVELCSSAVKEAICYGEACERFVEAFEQRPKNDGLTVSRAQGMQEALEIACKHALPGDVVLLSPACASFDEFSCYEERGEVFKRLVKAINNDA